MRSNRITKSEIPDWNKTVSSTLLFIINFLKQKHNTLHESWIRTQNIGVNSSGPLTNWATPVTHQVVIKYMAKKLASILNIYERVSIVIQHGIQNYVHGEKLIFLYTIIFKGFWPWCRCHKSNLNSNFHSMFVLWCGVREYH